MKLKGLLASKKRMAGAVSPHLETFCANLSIKRSRWSTLSSTISPTPLHIVYHNYRLFSSLSSAQCGPVAAFDAVNETLGCLLDRFMESVPFMI